MSNEQTKASRRGFFISASALGATVAAATWVKTQTPEALAAAPKPAPERGGGYSLSEHVKRYYKTTLV